MKSNTNKMLTTNAFGDRLLRTSPAGGHVRTGIVVLSIAIASTCCSSSTLAQNGKTVFTNLTDKNIYVASKRFVPLSSSQSAGEYNLPSERNAGWRIRGWRKVSPGESLALAPANFYVKRNDRALTWPARKSSWGMVLNGAEFDIFLPKGRELQKKRELMRKGYEQVNFQEFSAGHFQTTAMAYSVRKKTFRFDIQSRDFKFIEEKFAVPGSIVHYAINLEQKWANSIRWSKNRRSLRLTGTVSGKQVRPFGPREPGFCRGTVTVSYTVRNSTGGGLKEENFVISTPLPERVTSRHFDAQNGRTYLYEQSGGGRSSLRVYRPGKEIHHANLIGPKRHNKVLYFRYRINFTGAGAPDWAVVATNERRYEIWFPQGGIGTVLYSDDNGRTFVPEGRVPPAGRLSSS